MNKVELVAAMAEKTGLTRADAAKAVDAFVATVAETLQKGDDIRLVGFGSFSVTQRAASTGRNPRTGKEIKIPASKAPKFKAGAGLKEAVNK